MGKRTDTDVYQPLVEERLRGRRASKSVSREERQKDRQEERKMEEKRSLPEARSTGGTCNYIFHQRTSLELKMIRGRATEKGSASARGDLGFLNALTSNV